jgi:trk system potassium uptake protein TrkH
MLPVATVEGRIDATDAFFTATSAVCVTGLTVADTGGTFTRFGQIVILILIQLGGLGIMTVSVTIFRFLGKAVTYRQRTAMQDVFAATPRKDIYRYFVPFSDSPSSPRQRAQSCSSSIFLGMNHPWDEALFSGLFHSVSAFCNAGFGLYKANMMDFQTSILLNLTICGLIVSGGIGFPVVHDIHLYFFHASKKESKRPPFGTDTGRSDHYRDSHLWRNGYLVFRRAHGGILGKGLQHTLLTTLFQSVTCRTAGFNTVDIGALSNVTLLFMIFLCSSERRPDRQEAE